MRRLEDAHELLDGPLDERLLDGNLRDLARINRWLGGADLSERAIAPLAMNSFVLSILDVGTGGADIPLHLARDGREITATDIRPEIVAAATRSASRGRVAVRQREHLCRSPRHTISASQQTHLRSPARRIKSHGYGTEVVPVARITHIDDTTCQLCIVTGRN